MKKLRNRKNDSTKTKQERIDLSDDRVDHVEQSSQLNKKDCNDSLRLVRTPSLDATHRFGKRSGST